MASLFTTATIALQQSTDTFSQHCSKLSLFLSSQKCQSVLFTFRPFNPIVANIKSKNHYFESLNHFQVSGYYPGLQIDPKVPYSTPAGYRIQRHPHPEISLTKEMGRGPIYSYSFYKSFIRSIMDYGSILFANAPETSLMLLERIQNHSIRLALGAIKTTPVPALQYESKISPLRIRRIQLTQQYVLRTLSNSDTDMLNQYLTIYNTWRFSRISLLISQIYNSISGFHKHLIKTDKYPYKTLPYLEIVFEWSVKILKSISGNQSSAQ